MCVGCVCVFLITWGRILLGATEGRHEHTNPARRAKATSCSLSFVVQRCERGATRMRRSSARPCAHALGAIGSIPAMSLSDATTKNVRTSR